MPQPQKVGRLFWFLPLILSAYLLPQLLSHLLIPTVTLTAPTVLTTRTKVALTGTVIAKNQSDLLCEMPYVIDTVYVSVGDTVKVGAPVASIDQKATLEALVQLLQLSENVTALTEYLPEDITSVTELQQKLPSYLYAPASGTVTASDLKPNSLLSPGVSCLSISDCDTLLADLTVEEADAASVAIGDTVYLRSVSQGDTVFTASVIDIAPAAGEVLSGTAVQTVVSFTAALSQTDSLRPGYHLYGYLFPDEPQQKLLIPLSAVFQEGETEYLWLWEDGVVFQTPIVTEQLYQNFAVVTSGVRQDAVIVAEPGKLKNGMRVKGEWDA